MTYKYLILIQAFVFNIIAAYSQVTVGTTEKPLSGALLHLKNIDNINDDAVNATKGLLMPRVNLVQLSQIYPMYDYIQDIPSPLTEEEHTGLLVMNVTNNELICPGLHVWNGNMWVNLNNSGITYFEDTRTSNVDGTVENNIYPVQTFGEAGTWMLSNLRTKFLPDGTPLNILENEEGYIEYDNMLYYYPPTANGTIDPVLDRVYFQENPYLGLFYTWAAAVGGSKSSLGVNEGEGDAVALNSAPTPNTTTQIETVGIQGICPDGWHLPSDYEMNELEKYLSNAKTKYYDNSTEPTYLLDSWDDIWNVAVWESSTERSRGNAGKSMMSPYYDNGGLSRKLCDGISGFSAYSVGFIAATKDCRAKGLLGDYWTSSRAKDNNAWYRSFILEYATNEPAGTTRNWIPTNTMMSVRCKKDNLNYTKKWSASDLGNWKKVGNEQQIMMDNNYLKIITQANTNDRIKVYNDEMAFKEGNYEWKVYISDLELKSRCSIGAFIYHDDLHEIDFEIASGTSELRNSYNAQDDEVLVFMTSQGNPFVQEIVTIKKNQWVTLNLNLEIKDDKYYCTWMIDGKVGFEQQLNFGKEVSFSIFSSLENLNFSGDFLPTTQQYTLFDYVSYKK